MVGGELTDTAFESNKHAHGSRNLKEYETKFISVKEFLVVTSRDKMLDTEGVPFLETRCRGLDPHLYYDVKRHSLWGRNRYPETHLYHRNRRVERRGPNFEVRCLFDLTPVNTGTTRVPR